MLRAVLCKCWSSLDNVHNSAINNNTTKIRG